MFRQLGLIGPLIWKDWKLFLSDRRAALLCFAVPIVLASAFSMIFDRPARMQAQAKLPLIVVAEDDDPFTQRIVADLQQSEHVEVTLADRSAAQREITRRSGGVILVLPRGFANLTTSQANTARPVVEILHHPLSAAETGWAEGVLTEIVMRRLARNWLASLGMNEGHEIQRPFTTIRNPVLNSPGHPFNSRSHSFSGMTLQYLLFWGMECGLLLLRERKRGIWSRTRVCPVPLTTALIGKAFSTALIALLQIAATFGFGYLAFGVTITGSLVGFLLLAMSISVLAAGVGLLVASIGRTEASARSVFIVVILGVSMLGGLWLPTFVLPKWVQDWSRALPTSWAMRGLDGVTWQGLGLADVARYLLAVNAFAITFLTAAIVRFHWSDRHFRQGDSPA